MTNNAMILRTPGESDIRAIQTVAKHAYHSGLYKNLGSEAAIVMISMAAYELGIPYSMALSGGINVIQGKAEIAARTLNGLMLKAGHIIETIRHDEHGCWLKGTRRDTGSTYLASFTMEDASKAGLLSKDVWKKWASDMLWARAISRLARRMCPDVIGSNYVEGEIRGELKEEKCEVIENEQMENKEDPAELEQKINVYVLQYDSEWQEPMRMYAKKWCEYKKKSADEFIIDHQDKEKALAALQKWWEKRPKDIVRIA